MKKIIVANWKMNPASLKEAEELFDSVKDAGAVICPPSVFLSLLKGADLGAQNVFYEEKGAYTGEISALMAKDLGCKYVIVGHSERRKYFNETDEIANKKAKSVLKTGMIPIFCIGETEEERSDGETDAVLENQITNGLAGVSKFEIQNSKFILAYEPVWAIGTGNACSIEDSKKALDKIKSLVGNDTPVLYGGSVNSDNCAGYVKEAGFDGLLVGGASLKADEFNKIIKNAQ